MNLQAMGENLEGGRGTDRDENHSRLSFRGGGVGDARGDCGQDMHALCYASTDIRETRWRPTRMYALSSLLLRSTDPTTQELGTGDPSVCGEN